MHRWLILLGFGLANVPAFGADPSLLASTPELPQIHSVDEYHGDLGIRDTLGTISLRPIPDQRQALPTCLQRVDYLRQHNDNILAISYLRQLMPDKDLLPQYRARIILELADCLSAEHQVPEALCWLKLWSQLFPGRPEFGAVAYRIGTLYMQMGLTDMARDAFYLALAHTVNEAQVQNADDLKHYTDLTVGTLWSLAVNEYQSGQWARGAELFARFRKEAPSASPISQEKAAFLQADCYYQLRQVDNATSLYEDTLQKHPFNPLAAEARLRLYHLYMIKNAPEKAREQLEALVWTVRTVWPKDEAYWQKQTAEFLLALNEKNAAVLPPLMKQISQLPSEGKTWQEALNHYDALVTKREPRMRTWTATLIYQRKPMPGTVCRKTLTCWRWIEP
jgi:tetratricopeptide (TPR) repeat protein